MVKRLTIWLLLAAAVVEMIKTTAEREQAVAVLEDIKQLRETQFLPLLITL
jgi:hypothetical protein